MTDPVNPTTDVSQADYMKVFMQELAYQDPLKPIDNREFMAQMAQFSALQQAADTSQNVSELLKATYDNRGISLLGKKVKIADSNHYGTVEAIYFKENNPIEMRVAIPETGEVTVGLGQIIELSNK